MFAWVGQLRAMWDLAGQLVQLREEVDARDAKIEELEQKLGTIDERTRKQNYRARKSDEDESWRSLQQPAVPVGSRSELLRAARAKGLVT